MSENEAPSMPPPSPPPPPPENMSGTISAEERQWAMFAHLSSILVGLLTCVVGGWGTFIGPLIIWLVKKDSMPFAADHAKEALNFNIMISVIFLLMYALTIVTFGFGALLALPMSIIVSVGALVFTIIAAVKANDGQNYRYPLNIRLIT
jgi:uncharacterized protein